MGDLMPGQRVAQMQVVKCLVKNKQGLKYKCLS